MAAQKASVLYDFDAQNSEELTVRVGETVAILDQSIGDGWWMTRNGGGREGLVPSAYMELQSLPEPAFPPPPPPPPPPPTSAVYPPLYNNSHGAGDSYQDTYEATPESTPTSTLQHPSAPSLAMNRAPSEDWEDEDWDDSDDDDQTVQNRQNGGQTGHGVSPAGDAGSNRSMSIVSAENRDANARTRTVRGFPKIPGVKDFLCNDTPKRVSENDIVTIIETEHGAIWEPTKSPYTCVIAQPKKESKLKGLKSFIAYQVVPSYSGIQVSRRYKHFDWLYKQLVEKFPCICVPPPPDKQITGRYEDDFVMGRMRQLQLWMNRVTQHPVLGQSQVLNHFLSCTDEKRWKDGKRRSERDELRGGQFFLCIRPPARPVEWGPVEQHTDGFDNFVSEVDRSVKIMVDNVTNNSRKQQNQIRKEYQRLGEGFQQLAQAFEQDPDRRSVTLTRAVHRTASTYNDIGQLFSKQHEYDADPLLERLNEYIGFLSTLPQQIQVQRGAIQTVRECQRNLEEGRMNKEEFQSTVQRAAVISCAQTAEINYFQQERVKDFCDMTKDYLTAQIKFYREITHRLEEALALYNQ